MRASRLELSMERFGRNAIAAGFVLALAILVAIGAWMYHATTMLISSEKWVVHSQEVLQVLGGRLLVDLTEAQSARRGFVMSGDTFELDRYQAAADRIAADLDTLARLTAGHPTHQQLIEELQPLIAKRLTLWSESVVLYRAEGLQFEREKQLMLQGRELNEVIRKTVAAMEAEEAAILERNRQQVEASAARALLILVSGTVLSMALLTVVFVLLRREISERKRMEAELRQRTADLEGANKELESFSYSVSHDLRNPLGVIAGFSELLLDEYGSRLDETVKGYVQRMGAVAAEMLQMIKDLLHFSLAQRAEIRHERVDLSAIADEIVEELRAIEPDRQVTCVIARGLQATGDRGLLDVVLRNLIGNAWKFTRKQPAARIEVGTVLQEGRAAYYVRDNGIGFHMEDAAKVFGAFHRLPAAHEFAGSGIGLATVQRIVQRHGGRVWAEATPDRGASFYFTL